MKLHDTHTNKKRSNFTNTFTLFALLAIFVASLLSLSFFQLEATSVDDYIYEYDSSYGYTVGKKQESDKYIQYTLSMKSQSWRKTPEVDTPVWTHELYIIVPKKVRATGSLLIVKGGSLSKSDKNENPVTKNMIDTALETRSVVSVLTHVPNQPIRFIDEQNKQYTESGRKEDALIAYSWDKFMTTGDPRWSVRLPMAKAIVRAMDTIQDFTSRYVSQRPTIKRFVLAGESKRAWAAWVAASSDSRVEGLIPICLELGDISDAFVRHKRAYGKWSEVLKDYLEFNIQNRLNTSEFNQLMELESPYSSLDRVLIPKLVINATGDEFFLPDSSRYYAENLFGETHHLTIPNSGHRIDEQTYWPAVKHFYSSLISEEKLPQVNWNESDNKLAVDFDQKPTRILIWRAHNPNGRDFRNNIVGKCWKAEPVDMKDIDKSYSVTFDIPEKGWSAAFVELQFESEGDIVWRCTSPVFILPDTYPSED